MAYPIVTTVGSVLRDYGYEREASLLYGMSWRDQQEVCAAADRLFVVGFGEYTARELARVVRDTQGAIEACLYSEGEV